jgi:hypothetical protein
LRHRTDNSYAARQALLVDVMLLLFACVYFAKVSPRAGSVVLAAVLLLRWRRVYRGSRWIARRLYSSGIRDENDIVMFWSIRRAASTVFPIVALVSYFPSTILANALLLPRETNSIEAYSYWLAAIFVPIVLVFFAIGFATWRCPACGRNPGGHPWGKTVYRCAQCRARLEYRG